MKKQEQKKRAPKKPLALRMDMVADFLAGMEDPKEFVSPGIIGDEVLGAPAGEGSAYASGPCLELVKAGRAERNTRGQYRLVPAERARRRRKRAR